jgi:hypothetical protein
MLPRALFRALLTRIVGESMAPGADAAVWHTRLTALHFLTVFVPRHAFWLDTPCVDLDSSASTSDAGTTSGSAASCTGAASASASSSSAPATLRRLVLDAVLPLLSDAQLDVALAAQRMVSMTVAGALLLTPLPIGRAWTHALDLGVCGGDGEAASAEQFESSNGDDASSEADGSSPVEAPAWRFADDMIGAAAKSQHERATKERSALIKKFSKWARTKAPAAAKSDAPHDGASTAAAAALATVARTRLAGVLGCAALVLSEPFSVPAWLPALLDELIGLASVPKQVLGAHLLLASSRRFVLHLGLVLNAHRVLLIFQHVFSIV